MKPLSEVSLFLHRNNLLPRPSKRRRAASCHDGREVLAFWLVPTILIRMSVTPLAVPSL